MARKIHLRLEVRGWQEELLDVVAAVVLLMIHGQKRPGLERAHVRGPDPLAGSLRWDSRPGRRPPELAPEVGRRRTGVPLFVVGLDVGRGVPVAEELLACSSVTPGCAERARRSCPA